MRIKDYEIEERIEGFVNSIYDEGIHSGWMSADLEEWEDGVWSELCQWKSDGKGTCWMSDENRFDGKENTLPRIRKALKKRIVELAEEGYLTKVYHENFEK